MGDLELLDFIRKSIPSVWALRVLLLLRDAPARSWSMPELVGELRASDAVVVGVLTSFERDGLVARLPEGRFRFAPKVGERIDELCDALAAAYLERPVSVTTAIMAPDDRLDVLAEAFRLKDRRT